MRSHVFLCLGLVLASSGGALWLAASPQWRSQLAQRLPLAGAKTEPVLILVVGGAGGVARVRRAVRSDRVVAETPDAFALREGRIVAANPAAASAPLNAAGWAQRPIELWSTRAPEAPGPAQPESASGKSRIAELMAKDTLTPAEAMVALRLLDP